MSTGVDGSHLGLRIPMSSSYRGISGEEGIATLVSQALDCFQDLGLKLNETENDRIIRILEENITRFKLWAGNSGAHRAGGRSSLEYRLRDASFIRNHVRSLLEDLLFSIKNASSNFWTDQCLEDTGSAGKLQADELEEYFQPENEFKEPEVERLLKDMRHVIDCLLRLSETIRNPAPHDQFAFRSEAADMYQIWDVKHIREKFSQIKPGIAERLGRGMYRRRKYFKYRTEHANRIAQGMNEEDGSIEQATTVASSIPEGLKGEALLLDDFEDSQSNTSETSYATSHTNSEQDRVPPMPKEFHSGPSECPFCHMIVSIDTRRSWKKHVFRDLRPYMCLEESCPTPETLYIRRSEWIQHMKSCHWKSFFCHFGCPETFSAAEDFRNHIVICHKGFPAEDMGTLERLCFRLDAVKMDPKCPMCSEVVTISQKEYEKHVGGHLECLALFSLPKYDDGVPNDDESDGLDSVDVELNEQLQYEYADSEIGMSDRDYSQQDNEWSADGYTDVNLKTDIVAPEAANPYTFQYLDTRYSVQPSSRFQAGEIFKVYWTEPKGKRTPSLSGREESISQLGELIHTGFRRFLVLANDVGHSTCLPILTYESKACTKKGVKPDRHGIIHDERKKAKLLSSEPQLGFKPVRAQMTEPTESLAKESRINYSKPTTVEHNSLVFFIGRVHPDDFKIARKGYSKCWGKKMRKTSNEEKK